MKKRPNGLLKNVMDIKGLLNYAEINDNHKVSWFSSIMKNEFLSKRYLILWFNSAD